MASNIDATKPEQGKEATTSSVRDNFSAAKTEIEALQTQVGSDSLPTHIADTTTHCATGAVVGTTNTQTLTNKTLTSPAFSGTIADLGTVTTADINGGTIDNTTIGGSAAGAGTFTTLTGTTIAGGMIATQAEQETGTATDHIVVPGRQHFHPSAAKAWGSVTYSAGTPTLQDSFNVSGITDLDTGRLSVSWDTDFSSANYSVVAYVEAAGGATPLVTFTESGAQSAGSVILRVANMSSTATDPARINFVAFGDQ